MKKVFWFIMALWAMLMWISTLLAVSILYLLIFALGGKNAERTAHRLSRLWALTNLSLSGITVKVHHGEILDPAQTYVFVSNHRSQLDIPVCARSTSHFFKFLAKEELTKIPLLGLIIKRLYLTVNRGSVRDRVASIKKMRQALQEGVSLWIYPEGTRSKLPQPLPMHEFEDGAFRLAIDAGKPLAVAVIHDTGRNLPSGEIFQLRPARVDVHWLGIVSTEGLKSSDTAALKEKVKVMMEQALAGKTNC